MQKYKGKRRTSDEINEMVSLYKQGKTLEEVGFIYDLTRERVRQLFKKVGYVISRNPQDRNTSPAAKLARLKRRIERLKAGFSEAELSRMYIDEKMPAKVIAEISGSSVKIIREALEFYGIPIRTQSEVSKLYPVRYPKLTRENLLKLYIEEDKTLQQVADRCGCSKSAVANKLAEFGIRKKKRRNL